MYEHNVLINHLGSLSWPRKGMVRLTDRPDMTIAVYSGRKTTTLQLSPQGHLKKSQMLAKFLGTLVRRCFFQESERTFTD